ncbi:MAG: 50S ribosomal protein L29 [bacterium]|nr:50S ribosomal protein L29 [bacterium]
MKLRDLTEMTIPQLKEKLAELQSDYAELRFQRVSQPLDNPLRLRVLRRDIARAKTLLKEYEMGKRKAPGQ